MLLDIRSPVLDQYLKAAMVLVTTLNTH